MCINGEEMIEPCTDFRDEICVQGVVGGDPLGTYESFGLSSGDYIEAACRKNRWENCFGSSCPGVEIGDCYQAGFGIGSSVCIPEVPPGLKFWGDSSVNVVDSSTRVTGGAVSTAGGARTGGGFSTSRGGEVCSSGSFSCTAVWARSGVDRLIGDYREWECVSNCHCAEHKWIVAGNSLCKSLGDCGAYYNIMGEATMGGFSSAGRNTPKHEIYVPLTMSDIDNWNSLSKPSLGDYSEPGFFSEIGEEGRWAGLLGLGATGVYGWVVSGFAKGSLMAGASAGLKGFGALLPGAKSSWAEMMSTAYGGSSIGVGDKLTGTLSKSVFETATKESGLHQAGKFYFADATTAEYYISAQKALTKEYGSYALSGGVVPSNAPKLATIHSLEGGAVAKVGEKGTVTVMKEGGLEATAEAVSTPTSSSIMGWVNTLSWIYTIYSLVDILLAETEEITYSVSCGLWQAPAGGEDCEECNQDPNKPCSLYKCKSLGQLCDIVNPGTADEKCVNIHPNDVTSPIIKPNHALVFNQNYTIIETTIEGNQGFEINEKQEPFSRITLSIETDEVSQCKFSSEHGKKFNEIPFYFGDQVYRYNHTISFSFPDELTTKEALQLTNGGVHMLYIKCRDASGNANAKDYFIKFKLKPRPDLTAPVVEDTSISNGAYLPHDINDTELILYLNEPANCKWDRTDLEYEHMKNAFSCDTNGLLRAIDYYECRATLGDLGQMEEDTFYFKCEDLKGNINMESYPFTLKRSSQLYIVSSGPSGTLYIPEQSVKVITSGGAETGVAKCGYRDEDVIYENMIEFLETDDSMHEQPLNLTKGDYTYYVICRDVAGNEDSEVVSFKIDVDLMGPEIVYVYEEGNMLRLQMDEVSTCEYSNETFFFGDGIRMTGEESFYHDVVVEQQVYYISCVDEYDNEGSYVVYL